MSSTLYDKDFFAWANEQARLLRAGKLSEADIEHIAEEIESMGKTEKRELVSRLEVLLMHLLKWQFHPDRRGKSWTNTIRVQRNHLETHLADNPSLKSQLAAAIRLAYENAKLEAAAETDLDESVFPEFCAWSPQQILASKFWPDLETS
jgi:Domain of unknown function DUF29